MNLHFNDNQPFIEEVYINDIINSHSTPFYLYSQKIINDTFNNLKKNLSGEILYAVKANSNQSILKLLKNCGAGADVVSVGELERCINAGFDPNKIIFEGVGKSEKDIEFAIKQNIKLINVESFDELTLINNIGKKMNKIIKIGIRLNPDIDSQTLGKISTGNKTDKFGIELNQLDKIILQIELSSNVSLDGISCHIGSQIHNINTFKKVFETMKKTASLILSKKISLKYVDLGGGFGVNYEENQNEFDIKGLGDLIKSIFSNEPYEISFEPGRYLVAKAGILITKILTLKKNGGINFLITDAGMQTFIRPAMYNAFHRIEALNDLNENNELYTIAGPICESSDIISKEIYLPKQKTGNYLAIHDVGAYGAVMASNYNSRGLPSEILIHQNKFAIINIEETISELIKKTPIPNWL